MLTETVISTKVLLAWAVVPTTAFVLAATEAPLQTGIIYLVGLAITSITAIAVAWIGYKQNTHIRKQDALAVTVKKLEENTNGINTKWNEATAKESLARGKVEGIAEAENKANAIAVAKLEGAEIERQAKAKSESK